MTDSDERLAVFRLADGGETELRPGGALRLGRHQDNDIVISDSTASRFHATIRWERELERPVLYDNGSQNGTLVSGRVVRSTAVPLSHNSVVEVSDFRLTTELINCGETPAILKNSGDMVTLFSEQGPDIKGSLHGESDLREVMQRLEIERRSGTLKLKSSGATITICLGKIMDASVAEETGREALEAVFNNPGGDYLFSRELEPTEQGLNLWFSDFLRGRSLKGNATRQIQRRGALLSTAADDEDEPTS